MISSYSTLIIINSKSEFGYIYLQYIQMSIAYNISNQTIYSEGEEMSSDKNPNGTMVFPLILYGSSQGQNCHWPQLLLNTIWNSLFHSLSTPSLPFSLYSLSLSILSLLSLYPKMTLTLKLWSAINDNHRLQNSFAIAFKNPYSFLQYFIGVA